MSDIDFSKLSEPQRHKILEKYKWRRLFWYASPQVSQATIPKEFIIDTSELRDVLNQRKNSESFNHAKSHGWSPEK